MQKVQFFAALVSVVALFFCCRAKAAEDQPLLTATFAHGADRWQSTADARHSTITRRPGNGSLMISQWKDADQSSAWVSPPIANPHHPVLVSFWAADNYLRCGDFSYSACVDVQDQDAQGKTVSQSDYLTTIRWDDSRKSDMWGKLLPAGLVWKYYQAVYTPKGKTFRLIFHWPKPLLRGDCYLTDVRVGLAGEGQVAAPVVPTAAANGGTAPARPLNMEITTPVMGNLFYQDVTPSFDVLVYSRQNQPLPDLSGATLAWDISNFQGWSIARGSVPFAPAKPIADKTFYDSQPGATRKHNLLLSLAVADQAARAPGQEFFLHAVLEVGGQALGEQTASYGVVHPRTIDPKDYNECHLSSSWFSHDYTFTNSSFHDSSISVKSGISWDIFDDYGWKQVQPQYPGPYHFDKPRPVLPRIIYNPNTEQSRVQPVWIANEVPPQCIITDPLHPGRTTFKIEPYIEYMLAYIRHNRHAISLVVPSGLERTIDARTIELQRRAYAAIKKAFPAIKVGMCLYGLSMNPSSDVDLFLREKLYDCCDFIDTHIYASSVDWTEWERLQAAYRSMGRQPVPLISTEFARVGSSDQVVRARNMVAAHLDAWAHGMEQIYYFNQANEDQNHYLMHPFGRQPTDIPGSETGGFMYMQNMGWPKVSPEIAPSPQRWALGSWGHVYGGTSLMPLLCTMTYYNLVQNFELAKYRTTMAPSPNAIAYIFDRPHATVAAVWLSNPVGEETYRVRIDTPFQVQDLYGNITTLTPVGGQAMLTIGQNPLTLIVPQAKAAIAFEKVQGLNALQVPRGGTATLNVPVPAAFAAGAPLALTCTLDGRALPDAIKDLHQQTALFLPVGKDQAPGQYTLRCRLLSGNKVVGLLRTSMHVDHELRLTISAEPLIPGRQPALLVTIHSLAPTVSRGMVRFDDRYFSQGLMPHLREQPYQVAPGQSAVVSFPLDAKLINLTTDYRVSVEVTDSAGLHLTRTEYVAFRACRKATGPIKIDADLSDWDLKQLTPIPFEREFTNWGKPYGGPQDIGGVFYTRWDSGHLYFAAIINDQFPVQRFNNIDAWQDDNIMFGLYPWGWNLGQAMHSGYYREHIARCADGTARIFRVGNPEGGPPTPEGCRVAVKYADGRWIYEWEYPKAAISPMRLDLGAAFRVSVFPLDRDLPDPGPGKEWPLGGVQFGGFNTSTNARPAKWRQFVLTN